MSHDPNCIFCKIVKGEIPSFKIYEDETTFAFLDINPINPGHCLIVPKAHNGPTLMDCDPEAVAFTAKTVQKMAKAVQKALNPDGINILQANGPGAAQSVMHLHMHVVPRRLDDNVMMNWGLKPGDKAELAAIAEKIKAAI